MLSRVLQEESDTKPWGDVILASFLVWLVTFVGLLLGALTSCVTSIRHNHVLYRVVIPSFASGALLATCVFLLIPESLELLAEAAGGEDAHDHEESAAAADFSTANGTASDEAHDDHDHDHFFLARRLQEGELHTEHGFAWKFGASLLGGFLFPIVLHAFFPSPAESCDECQSENEAEDQVNKEEGTPLGAAADETRTAPTKDVDSNEGGQGGVVMDVDANKLIACDSQDHEQDSKTSPVAKVEPPRGHAPLDWPLICSVLLGDFLHNFTDGIFIGTAFLLCSRDIGYTLVATTIYHEMAQELADFVVLTVHCGLPVWKAVVANALSGASVLLGGLVILSADLSEGAIGIILSVSAGVYVYITACECVPKIMKDGLSPRQTLLFVLWFTLGAIPIGLVLLNHGHCEASHDEAAAEDEATAAEMHNDTARWLR